MALGQPLRYAWIEANIDSYSVTMMCDLLSVSRSGLHDARGRVLSQSLFLMNVESCRSLNQ